MVGRSSTYGARLARSAVHADGPPLAIDVEPNVAVPVGGHLEVLDQQLAFVRRAGWNDEPSSLERDVCHVFHLSPSVGRACARTCGEVRAPDGLVRGGAMHLTPNGPHVAVVAPRLNLREAGARNAHIRRDPQVDAVRTTWTLSPAARRCNHGRGWKRRSRPLGGLFAAVAAEVEPSTYRRAVPEAPRDRGRKRGRRYTDARLRRRAT